MQPVQGITFFASSEICSAWDVPCARPCDLLQQLIGITEVCIDQSMRQHRNLRVSSQHTPLVGANQPCILRPHPCALCQTCEPHAARPTKMPTWRRARKQGSPLYLLTHRYLGNASAYQSSVQVCSGLKAGHVAVTGTRPATPGSGIATAHVHAAGAPEGSACARGAPPTHAGPQREQRSGARAQCKAESSRMLWLQGGGPGTSRRSVRSMFHSLGPHPPTAKAQGCRAGLG